MFLGLETFTFGLFHPSMLSIGRFQKSRFQVSKRSNMGSAVPEGGRPADFHEFCFQAAKRSNMDCVGMQGGLFVDCQEWKFSGLETFR